MESCDGSAGVYPERKFKGVHVLKNRGWPTGIMGDGVNDVPALRPSTGRVDCANGYVCVFEGSNCSCEVSLVRGRVLAGDTPPHVCTPFQSSHP